MKISSSDKAYAAGLFDGEGTVGITKPSPHHKGVVTLQIVNTDIDVILWLHSKWGGQFRVHEATGLGQRQVAMLTLGSRQAENFLRDILPYARVKRRQLELALLARKHTPAQGKRPSETDKLMRVRIREAIMALNRGMEPVDF